MVCSRNKHGRCGSDQSYFVISNQRLSGKPICREGYSVRLSFCCIRPALAGSATTAPFPQRGPRQQSTSRRPPLPVHPRYACFEKRFCGVFCSLPARQSPRPDSGPYSFRIVAAKKVTNVVENARLRLASDGGGSQFAAFSARTTWRIIQAIRASPNTKAARNNAIGLHCAAVSFQSEALKRWSSIF